MKQSPFRITGSALLLALFLWFFVGTNLFTHVHCEDSHRIVHSHPYKGNPQEPHHAHDFRQLLTISLLSHWTSEENVPFLYSTPIFSSGIIRPRISLSRALGMESPCTGRGPPFSFHFPVF